MQNNTTQMLQLIYQSQQDYANDSPIDDIPTFVVKPKLCFMWILKLDSIAAVTSLECKGVGLVGSSWHSY